LGETKIEKPPKGVGTPQRLAIGSFWKLLHMTFSISQKTVPAMGALIVWSEEDRTKGMVS
jgi:hypothetical protein